LHRPQAYPPQKFNSYNISIEVTELTVKQKRASGRGVYPADFVSMKGGACGTGLVAASGAVSCSEVARSSFLMRYSSSWASALLLSALSWWR
ncbi:MAG: hypothetical protein ACYSP9_08085, partial [Planctomycetota bacterium]